MLWREFSVRFDMSFDEFMRLGYLCLMIWMIGNGAQDLYILVAFGQRGARLDFIVYEIVIDTATSKAPVLYSFICTMLPLASYLPTNTQLQSTSYRYQHPQLQLRSKIRCECHLLKLLRRLQQPPRPPPHALQRLLPQRHAQQGRIGTRVKNLLHDRLGRLPRVERLIPMACQQSLQHVISHRAFIPLGDGGHGDGFRVDEIRAHPARLGDEEPDAEGGEFCGEGFGESY
jgi:hypothetical protein